MRQDLLYKEKLVEKDFRDAFPDKEALTNHYIVLYNTPEFTEIRKNRKNEVFTIFEYNESG